jgi:hypothetical protein
MMRARGKAWLEEACIADNYVQVLRLAVVG